MVTMVGSYRLEVLDCSLGQLAQIETSQSVQSQIFRVDK